jgi:hypothetical protein
MARLSIQKLGASDRDRERKTRNFLAESLLNFGPAAESSQIYHKFGRHVRSAVRFNIETANRHFVKGARPA